ncbi:hypothetical protein NDU88_001792 [Pleurodeles waltl]|uniref:Uncharacterized protein n=1 Tax=Pleurodeles waltl TaxID=8319 RepID=A0AAV7T0L7_PLEWA|nr:hypothetical protein NDU88_001792 [Pleurodeles waltl]
MTPIGVCPCEGVCHLSRRVGARQHVLLAPSLSFLCGALTHRAGLMLPLHAAHSVRAGAVYAHLGSPRLQHHSIWTAPCADVCPQEESVGAVRHRTRTGWTLLRKEFTGGAGAHVSKHRSG